MKKIVVFLITLLIGLYPYTEQNKTFIVLSGGGAKGIAHLAFMENLKENNINFQGIVGVSAGSIAAALYSYYDGNIKKLKKVGKEIYELNVFNEIVEKFGLSDKREKLPIFSIFFSEVKLLRKASLFNISEVKKYLYDIFGGVNIEDLPIPIYIAALNVNTGEYTIFTKGELVPRILASMAIPGVFPPQKIEDNYYVDGGALNNVPVSVAYLLGAETIYLSDISDVFSNRNEPNNGIKLFIKLEDIKSYYINSFERKMATYLVDYNFTQFKWYSFNKYDDIYQKAYKTLKEGFIKNVDIDLKNVKWYVENQSIKIK